MSTLVEFRWVAVDVEKAPRFRRYVARPPKSCKFANILRNLRFSDDDEDVVISWRRHMLFGQVPFEWWDELIPFLSWFSRYTGDGTLYVIEFGDESLDKFFACEFRGGKYRTGEDVGWTWSRWK